VKAQGHQMVRIARGTRVNDEDVTSLRKMYLPILFSPRGFRLNLSAMSKAHTKNAGQLFSKKNNNQPGLSKIVRHAMMQQNLTKGLLETRVPQKN
jgi:hypothetical protein